MEEVDVQKQFTGLYGSRVDLIEIHLVLPLIAVAYEDGKIIIWDYVAQIKVSELVLDAVAEDRQKAAYLSDLAEKDPNESRTGFGRILPMGNAVNVAEKTKYGQIRAIRFCDEKTRKWKRNFDKFERLDATSPDIHEKVWDSWLIISTDIKVIFFNFLNQKMDEVEALGGEKSVYIEPWGNLPWIAFGGSDGNIRIYDASKGETTKTLKGHSKQIVRLFAYEADGQPMLCSIGAEGSACVWNANANCVPNKYKLQGDVSSVSWSAVDNSIVTSGSDKTIVVWDITVAKDKLKHTKMKSNYVSVEHFPHPRFLPNTVLVTSKDDGKVHVLDKNGTLHLLFDLSSFLVRSKGEGRISFVQVHPVYPHLLFVAAKTSLFVFSIQPSTTPTFAIPSGKGENSSRVFTCPDYSVESRELAFLDQKKTMQIIDKNASKAVLLISPSRKYLTIRFLDSQSHQLFDITSSPWKLIEEDRSKFFAWGQKSDSFAVLRVSSPSGAEQDSKDKKSKKSSKKVGTDRPVGPTLTFTFKEVIEADGKTEVKVTSPSVQTLHPITNLFSGLLLGVVVEPEKKEEKEEKKDKSDKNTNEDKGDIDVESSKLQFYNWTGNPIGGELPSPSYISWDPLENYVIMAFSKYSCIFSLKPFKLFAQLPFSVTSVFWYQGLILYATTSTIGFVVPQKSGLNPILLASNAPEFTVINDGMKALIGPPLVPRPIGSVSLIMIQEQSLIVLDVLGRLSPIKLTHPAFFFYLSALTGKFTQAVQWGNIIRNEYHLMLAEFLIEMGSPASAVQLIGLKPTKKLEICIEHNVTEDIMDDLSQLVVRVLENVNKSADELISSEIFVKKDDITKEELYESLVKLAQIHDKNGHYRVAVSLLKLAVKLSSRAHEERVALYVRNGKTRRLQSLNKKLQAAKKWDESVSVSLFLEEEALQLALKNSNSPASFLAYNLSQGNKENAETTFKRVNDKYPNIPPIQFDPQLYS